MILLYSLFTFGQVADMMMVITLRESTEGSYWGFCVKYFQREGKSAKALYTDQPIVKVLFKQKKKKCLLKILFWSSDAIQF